MSADPDTYVYEKFLIQLVDDILEGDFETAMPVHKTIFGIPLTYNRVEKTYDVNGSKAVERWVYTLSRGDLWSMEMSNRPSDAESVWKWNVTGDLGAARRDLSLLKMATD